MLFSDYSFLPSFISFPIFLSLSTATKTKSSAEEGHRTTTNYIHWTNCCVCI